MLHHTCNRHSLRDYDLFFQKEFRIRLKKENIFQKLQQNLNVSYP